MSNASKRGRLRARSDAPKPRAVAPVKKAAPAPVARKRPAPAKAALLTKKAPAKAPAKKARAGFLPNGLPIVKAPAEFKSSFFQVNVGVESDGLIGSVCRVIRVQGRMETAPERARRDLATYDVPTMIGIQARLAAKLFATNPSKIFPADAKERNATKVVKHPETGEKKTVYVYSGAHRLPANAKLKILLRVNHRADGTIGVSLKGVTHAVLVRGVLKGVELDKTDLMYKRIRGAIRFMPPAFRQVQMPPKLTSRHSAEDE